MEYKEKLRKETVKAALKYYKAGRKAKSFMPGDRIPYAGRVYDEKEIGNLIDASLEFWLTAGKYAEKFETEFARFLGIKYCSLVNSGSSANLLAFMALTSPRLGEKRIKSGDEVITVAAGFPTTIAASTANAGAYNWSIPNAIGTTATEIGFVAKGVYDFHIQAEVKIWDFAAAALLIQEAGGKITDWRGKPLTLASTNLVASNGKIHSQLLKQLKKPYATF